MRYRPHIRPQTRYRVRTHPPAAATQCERTMRFTYYRYYYCFFLSNSSPSLVTNDACVTASHEYASRRPDEGNVLEILLSSATESRVYACDRIFKSKASAAETGKRAGRERAGE